MPRGRFALFRLLVYHNRSMRTRFLMAVAAVVLLGFLILSGLWHGQSGAGLSHAVAASHTNPVLSSAQSSPPPVATASTTTLPALPPAGGIQSSPSLAGLPVVAGQDTALPGRTGWIKRVRILKADFKYPLWRVEETLQPGGPGQQDRVFSRRVMVADHAVVRLNSPSDSGKLQSLIQTLGLSLRRAMHMPGCYLVSIPDQTPAALPRLLALLNREPGLIRYAEPDYIVHTQQTLPNDPYFSSLWGLRNASRPGADISATKAWDLTTGGTQVVVAVIDTGVFYTHPDLAANIWTNTLETANGLDDDGNGYVDDVRGWNFVTDTNDPKDDQGHGSHCAGTIGGVGNNGTGVAGVNWRCRILPIKFLDASGSGAESDAADALFYVAGLRQRGVNIRLTSNSWGGGENTATLLDAIRTNAALGILCIVAAGNDGLNNDQYPFYPASYGESNMIAVAATDSRDALANFSNYGAASVHLAAPGVSIISTYLNGGYATMSGTSMATPHVAGAAALLWNTWPTARAEDIRDALLRGVDPLASLSAKTITGGRLNAFKALQRLFRIVHTPLENAFNNGSDYQVDAEIGPALFFTSNTPTLFWNQDGSTNYASRPFTLVSNSLYRAFIPLQPQGSTLRYWIQASATNTGTVTAPADAPASVYSFFIVPSAILTVEGTPGKIDSVTPPYGTQVFPSGNVFTASAPAATPATNGMRWVCTGWTGSGSVPASGNTNSFTFPLTNDSTLTWQWRREYALSHTNAFSYRLNSTTWWPENSTATTLTAAVILIKGTNILVFTGWDIDGQRQPDATSPAVNPATNILMNGPHLARVSYLPASQDANANGISDWWEMLYFGSTNLDPSADADGDGFSNRSEYLDATHPRDPDSLPEPPSITHTPLADPQSHPAPFPVTAVVTDNFRVVSATLFWTVNGGGANSTGMGIASGSVYRAELPAPGTNSDTFAYWIVAADAWTSTTNGPHTFIPRYPVVTPAPAGYDALVLPETVTNLLLALTNTGTAVLNASLRLVEGGHHTDFESGAGDWTHSGTNDLWQLSTNRSVSGTTSWYCGTPSSGIYASSMHASLDTPPLYLASGARLSFNHWIQCELDSQYWRPTWRINSCWDGGIVEISTNNGATFSTLTPEGGYPNLISGYYASPWPEKTPCFAGTGSWSRAVFDLSSYTDCVAIIRFEFGTDENTEEEGWYIDDVTVSPVSTATNWLSLDAANLSVAPLSAGSFPEVVINTTGIPTGDRASALWMASNDPVTPITTFPVHLRVRSPATLAWLGASQTSTNGLGLVALTHRLNDADGDACLLEMEWTAGAGGLWSNLWLTAVQASQGSALFSNGVTPCISNLVTQSDAGLPVTNLIVSGWDTQHPGNGPVFAAAALVRARAWDPLFCGNWVTSQPFMVDNERPPTPTHFVSLVHRTNTWSMNPVMTLRWDAVQEPRGSGVADYVYGVSTNLTALMPAGASLVRFVSTARLSDGTNLWAWVRARDGFGNLSVPAVFGPCWIDANPPSIAGATVSLAHSLAGNFLIGATTAPATWSGFSDAGSGIAGYYYAPTNAGRTTRGIWTTNLQGVLTGLSLDRTNTFYVWARDQLGWISPAIGTSCLVLSPNGDWDRDGVPNALEETAGTDAASAGSRLKLDIAANQTGENEFLLQWQGITNRYYAVSYSDTLYGAPNWAGLPGGTNLAGINGLMSCTDRTARLPVRFYRITVTTPR
jgi:subtilisin family serine protease